MPFCMLLVVVSVLMPVSAHALDAKWDRSAPLPFGVINQRSIAFTAEYWNPILAYVSRRSGVPLQLRMAKTAPETTEMSVRDELAFVYSNHLFTPECKVQAALSGMMNDPEGAEVLRVASEVIGKTKPGGFVASSNRDYENYRRFYHET